MKTQEAIELLEQQKNLICHDCAHPAMGGWCENHCKLSEAFDMAIEALKVQADSDTISRKAAMDALEKVAELFPWRVPGNRDSYDRYNEAWNDAIGRAEIEIEKLPSAQPDTDTVSRGAAIEAVKNALDPNIVNFVKAKMAIEALPPSQLIQPPAQPDRQAIDGYLFNLYRDGLSLIDTESVLSKKHWIKLLYAEIFGEGERPVWMRKDE